MSSEKRLIQAADLYRIVYVEDPRISPDGRWVAYVQVTVDKLDNDYKRSIWLAPIGEGKPMQLTRSGKDTQPRWSPDGTRLAFTSARDEKPQIYLLPVQAPGGEARQLTRMSNGATNPAWSPDGRQIAFLSPMNAAAREQEDSGEIEPPPADKLAGKHRKERRDHDETRRFDPRVIERLPYRTGTSYLTDRFNQIYVIDTAEDPTNTARKPRRLTALDCDYAVPAWSPDGTSIWTARVHDPAQDEPWRWSSIYRLSVTDGTEIKLTDELAYTSVLPQPSPDGRYIAFLRLPRERLSERMPRLAIMALDAGAIVDVNESIDRSVVDFRWSADTQHLVFSIESWGDISLHRVHIASGEVTPLIDGQMQIEGFDLHADGHVAYALATPANPNELYWKDAQATEVRALTAVNASFLAEIHVAPIQELRWVAEDGQPLQGWFLLPPEHTAGQIHPLGLNIHGGPHIMWGPATKSMWHEWQCHAARGYIVFFCNPRGANGYGESFQMALHAQWGPLAMGDILSGLDALLEHGHVDPQRLALTGGSYGGYMTAWITAHSSRFVAAVAQRGVYNLLSFAGVSDIPSFIANEFGPDPWENPDFLWQNSPLAHAHRIKTPLLIIHSENDFRVPISEGEQLYTYVRRTGGTTRLIRFPREGHELTRTGEPEHRLQSLNAILEWWDRYCGLSASPVQTESN